jgi:hypothetical protein
MQLLKSLLVSAALAASACAASAQTFVALSSPGFTTETTSLGDNYLKPIGPAGSTVATYSVLSTNSGFFSTAVVNFAATNAYTFLWGSPDTFNTVTDSNGVVVNGASFSSGTGNNGESKVYTFTDSTAFTSLTFKTTGVAFELAVAAVPEPEIYALMLAGFGAMALVARRRKIPV